VVLTLVLAGGGGAAPGQATGPPRSAGYWTKWNRCAAGNQAAMADRNGGRRAGFWLLEDVLAESGGAIIWDDGQADTLVVRIATCEQAVEILEGRRVTANGVVGEEPRQLEAADRALARQLLTAQLNVEVGACVTPQVNEAVARAEALLDRLDYDGTSRGPLLGAGSADHAQALGLAAYLDAYNRCDCRFEQLPAVPGRP
jgi:hypothetical protein